MKILIAVDSFKGSLTSLEISEIISQQLTKAADECSPKKDIEIMKFQIADGGEGTVAALVSATNGKLVKCKAKGPFMEDVDSSYGIIEGDVAVIDMTTTCSMVLIQGKESNPKHTTTFGMGEQIKNALNKGIRKFVIGVGGSCTNDCGIGLFQSLGFKFYNKNNELIDASKGGKQLIEIERIDRSGADKRLSDCEFTIASDVKNPLYGKNGAAYVYSPQKGASPQDVLELDKGLKNFAQVVKKTFDLDIAKVAGAGAAGGLGGGLFAFLGAKMQSGIELILKFNRFEIELENANLVITGEGKFDSQTLCGKAPSIIANMAIKNKIPLILVCAKCELGELQMKKLDIVKVYEIANHQLSLEEYIKKAKVNLKHTAREIAKDLFECNLIN